MSSATQVPSSQPTGAAASKEVLLPEYEEEADPDDEHLDITSKKRLMSQMADLKSYEAHDLHGDLIMTDPHPGASTDSGFHVSSELLDLVKERLQKLPAEEFDLQPALDFGFSMDEIAACGLRWSQKEDDVEANKYNIDKCVRRLADFGKFFADHKKVFAPEPLQAERSLEIMRMVGLVGDATNYSRDGLGRLVVILDFPSAQVSQHQNEIERMKARGVLAMEFIRAYTWFILSLMKQPASSREGSIWLINYGFMAMSDARSMQKLFGGKLQKTLQKLFHGTCPVKIKSMVAINCPWWMRMMIAFARVFVSSKIMGRFHVMGDKHTKLAEYFGGPEHIPKEYFGVKRTAKEYQAAEAAQAASLNGGAKASR